MVGADHADVEVQQELWNHEGSAPQDETHSKTSLRVSQL